MNNPYALILLLLAGPAFAQDQQVGARAKAMGGSYTAFEDDPVSVWLNPAGIATQLDAMAIDYQSYTVYEVSADNAESGGPPSDLPGEITWTDPAIVPAFIGATFQIGTPESPQSLGVCFTTPFRLKFGWVDLQSGGSGPGNLGIITNQTFYRLRTAYARDFRLKASGSEGFFTHVAVGIAGDISVTACDFAQLKDISPNGAATLSLGFNDMGFGGGAGLLVGVYDNTRNLKVNFGAAYQSQAKYDFSVSTAIVPLFNWPDQIQAGMTFYLLEGLPLRLTVDAQIINWDKAVDDSTLPGVDSFRNAVNTSAGVEYRLKASEKVTLYPRAGIRHVNAPWSGHEKADLPAIKNIQLFISPEDSTYIIGSAGLGIGWSSDTGKTKSIDIGFDFGGDAPGVALSYTTEF